MNNKAFGKALEKRTRQFAVSVIRLSARLPNSPEAKIVRNQLTDAGTSVGANYREANRSRSRADFRNKMKIKEVVDGQLLWLEVVVEAQMLEWKQVKPLYDECSELLAIFTAAIDSLSRGAKVTRNPDLAGDVTGPGT